MDDNRTFLSFSGFKSSFGLWSLWLFIIFLISTPTAFGMSAGPDEMLLQQALIAGHYGAVERELNDLQRGYLAGVHNDWLVDYAFRSFATTNPQVGKQLSLWVKRRPHSAIAHAAEGIYQENLGWMMRGTQWAQDTSDTQFMNMERHFKLAYGELEEATKLDPLLSVAYAHLVRMYKAFATREARTELFKEAIAHCGNSFAIRYEYLYSLQPRWGGSIAAIRQFIADDAEDRMDDESVATLHGFADYALGQDLIIEGKYDEAIEHYNKALTNNKFALYYIARGYALSKSLKFEQSDRDYIDALASEPHYSQALEGKANNDIAMGKLATARSDVDTALQVDPLNPSLLRMSVTLYYRQGRTQELLAALKKTLVYDPENPATYRDIGTIENFLKNGKAAGQAFQRATRLAPDKAEYWFGYAQAMYGWKQCEARVPLEHYRELCGTISAPVCNPNYMQWAEGALKTVRSNSACARTAGYSSDTRGKVQ